MTIGNVFKLFPFRDRVRFFYLFVMMLIASALELIGIGMVPLFLSALAVPDQVWSAPLIGEFLLNIGIDTHQSLIYTGAILLILVYVIKNIYLVWYTFLKQKLIAAQSVWLQNLLFRAYMTASYEFYVRRNSAELLRNIISEVSKVFNGFLVPYLEITLRFLMFLFIISTLLYFEPLITIVATAVIGGSALLFLNFTQKKMALYGQHQLDSGEQMNRAVMQGLGGFKEAKVLKREALFLDSYNHGTRKNSRAGVHKTVMASLPKPMIETLIVTGILIITFVLIAQGRDYGTIIPILALFGTSAVKLLPIVYGILSTLTEVRYHAPSVAHILQEISHLQSEQPGEQPLNKESSEKMTLNQYITLNGVSYSYQNSRDHAVDEVTLQINKGEVVAFVGASGAGKTTIVDLILGLLRPLKGSVLVDGTDIRKNTHGWMLNIGYIPQSIYLLDDTIRRNITFGIPNDQIDEYSLARAIEAAQLQELIDQLPEGDQTIVGERGIRLSGGQKQRIGIARALYHNPQVLIMDEATSALDNVTEQYIVDAIETLRGDRTIIMIAHRLTTVEHADRIYLMENGKIIANGSFEELLKNSPEFRKMNRMSEEVDDL